MRSMLVVLALLVSGCFGAFNGQPGHDDPHQVAQDAVERFTADFASRDGGDLRLVRGEFGGNGSAGFADASFEAEWGKGSAVRVEISVGSGDASFTIALHCDVERTVISYGERRIETRPTPGTCLESLQEDNGSLAEFDGLVVDNVTAHKDGRITAIMSSKDGNLTVHIDPEGRLSRIDLDQGGFMRIEYGPRRLITMPEDAMRMPAAITGIDSVDDGRFTWTVASVEERVPLSEIEVRVQDPANETVAVFAPAAGQESEVGLAFTFVDDGDGLVTAGDSFTIDGWDQGHEVVVWDLWAQRALGDFP